MNGLADVPGRRKTNYPLIFLSCLILMLATWNVWRAEQDFYGSDDSWGEAASVMLGNAWNLPDISSYGWSNSGDSLGVIILGMHRSGTSMLAGLLATAYHYYPGEDEDLIPPRYANAKGYFERFDIVRQNDKFLQAARDFLPNFKGNILFSPTVIIQYNERIDPHKMVNETMDEDFTTALKFLNNQHDSSSFTSTLSHPTVPWVQKDPRMCITLRTWLPFLQQAPAVLITYRHPAEVGHSVATRDHKPMLIGLRSWIAYNAALVRNSMGLCTVVTKNSDLLESPVREMHRIVHELTHKCKVVPPPIVRPNPSIVDDFIDLKMQGSRHEALTPCVNGKPYFNVTTSGLQPTSRRIYRKAMAIYCDMETGIAFLPNYTGWPDSI